MALIGCPHCHAMVESHAGHFACGTCGARGAPAGTVVVQQQQTGQGDGLSLAAMIVGLASIVVAAPVSSIVAIVLGSMALNRGVQGTDRTYALVGLWSGVATLLLGLFSFVLFLMMWSAMGAW